MCRGTGTPFGWSLANLLFFKKVKYALGLDRCHFQMTGAAPANEDTLSYFMSVNIPLHEMYGMSETTGMELGQCMSETNLGSA
jgi:long-chain-fatty-acid--CoA ligase ACSBG